ncbi:MAG: hypothetical protein ACOYOK_10790 [Pseudobdellovibrionaceae bacterium]
MSVTLQKALNILSKSGAFRRIILAWNKTPLRYLSKTAAVIAHFGQFKRRYAMIKNYTLSESEEKIVRQLHSDGYADLSSHINLDLLNQLHDYSHEKLNRVESIHQQAKNKNKDFWVRLSDEDIGDQVLSAANPMVQFAIQENILKIIGKYIGQTAFLEYVLLTLSLPSEGDFKSSQLWHFDRDETKMLKLFVYLTDVKETASGPFTFIDKKNSQKVKNSFIMRHLHDADIFKYVSTSDQIQ